MIGAGGGADLRDTGPAAGAGARRGGSAARVAFSLLLFIASACTAQPIALPPILTPAATSPSDNPTAGAARRATQQAQATRNAAATTTQLAATQQAGATQTAEAGAKITQTAQAQATVAARATGQAVLAAKAAWPQRLLDPFSDNQIGWPVGLTQDQYLAVTTTVAGGHYHWVTNITSSGAYTNLVPAKGAALTDFYAQVTVQFGPGNDDSESAYGLVFRNVNDDYGFFGILKTGGFIAVEAHQSSLDQYDLDSSSAINTLPGAANRVAVAAVGPDFVFLVNDHEVGQMTADLAPGQIGVGVEAPATASEAEVDFSNFQINAP